jgi:acetyl-CoA acetyltransferase
MSGITRGATAIVGIGQTPWYGRESSPDSEQKLALQAIVAAAEDAGIDPRDIDGFVSYGMENNAGHQLMPGLGTRDLRYGALVWTHGGGIPGAVGLAATGIISGQADIVVVYRAMSDTNVGSRLRVALGQDDISTQAIVNGVACEIPMLAITASHLIEADGVPPETLRAFVLASYYHAQRNPHAFARNTAVDEEAYEASPWAAEPLHHVDCPRVNDSAVAVILVAAERAKSYKQMPAYVLSAPMGRFGGKDASASQDPAGRTTAGFRSVAKRLWAESGYGPGDVDVAQFYTNASSAAVNAIIDHDFCTWENVGEFVRFENLIAPNGRLPINTAGGDLADGFVQGMGNVPEAVRQIRGTSPNQVPGARLSFMSGGPNDGMVSSMLLGSEDTL